MSPTDIEARAREDALTDRDLRRIRHHAQARMGLAAYLLHERKEVEGCNTNEVIVTLVDALDAERAAMRVVVGREDGWRTQLAEAIGSHADATWAGLMLDAMALRESAETRAQLEATELLDVGYLKGDDDA